MPGFFVPAFCTFVPVKLTVYPSYLTGSIYAPPSKSIFQRAVAAALLAPGTSRLSNPCFANDGLSALAMAGHLGAQIEEDGEDLLLHGGLNPIGTELNAGEAGLGIRLFTPIAALHDGPLTMVGEGSLATRPMGMFETILPPLGAFCSTADGKLPIAVKGPLKGGTISLDGSLSSQFLTGLLMALPLAAEDSTLHVKDLKSTPYIEMTLEVMAHYGVHVTHTNFETFEIPGGQAYKPKDIYVDGDWSGAAFQLIAGALSGKDFYEVKGLPSVFTQADQAVTGALLFAGCKVKNQQGDYQVVGHQLRGIDFDLTDCPDLFPPLAAMAVFGDKPSRFTGVHRLKHKESDRGVVLRDEFAKAGLRIDLDGDVMTVHPGEPQAATLDSNNDHRIAMAAALLGMGGTEPITITGAEAIRKSYPDFFADMSELGGNIQS